MGGGGRGGPGQPASAWPTEGKQRACCLPRPQNFDKQAAENEWRLWGSSLGDRDAHDESGRSLSSLLSREQPQGGPRAREFQVFVSALRDNAMRPLVPVVMAVAGRAVVHV